jgi:hypothetical protein
MTSTRTHTTLAATLATAALVTAPAALAKPIDVSGESDAGHAATASVLAEQHAAQAAARPDSVRQDLRSPDARDAARHRPAAIPAGRAGAPAWPVHPTPLHSAAQSPAPTGGDDDGTPWALLALGVTGLGLAGTGAALGIARSAGRRRARAVA